MPPSVATKEATPEDLNTLVAQQAAVRAQIKREKAEKQLAGRGRGGKGRGGKGKSKKGVEEKELAEIPKPKEKKKPEKPDIEKDGRRKKQRQEKEVEPVNEELEKKNKEKKKERQEKEVKHPKAKAFVTPFKSGVKVRNPHGSPKQRKSKREARAKASLLKLKRMKTLLPALKMLPLPEDETKMNFS